MKKRQKNQWFPLEGDMGREAIKNFYVQFKFMKLICKVYFSVIVVAFFSRFWFISDSQLCNVKCSNNKEARKAVLYSS